jgi:hypothetical protein
VTDSATGLPIAGATVTLRLKHGHSPPVVITTGSDGKFSFKDIKPGDWILTANATGMLSESRQITLGKKESPESFKFALDSVEVSDVMRVTGKRTLTHPNNTAPTTYMNKELIDDYKTGNNLRDLVGTAPGITQDSFGNMVVRGEHNTITYVLDDVVLPEAVGQIQQGQAASPHSLESMTVTDGGYQASDGGGAMGAMVRMKSVPLTDAPTVHIGTQIGGPLAGGINFDGSTALSQDTKSPFNNFRIQTSGQVFANKLGIEPAQRHFTRDGRLDMNILNKVEWRLGERDRIQLTGAINETWMHIPTSHLSRTFGFKEGQHDRQNYLILSYRHQFRKWLDEGNLHLVNGFLSQRLTSTNAFNPDPIVNGDAAELVSASPTAKRFNYVFSAQGDVRKTVFKTHHLTAGFLSEVRPVKTYFASYYYNANPALGLQGIPYGAQISSFTMAPGGPQLLGNVGNYKGFRYLQSVYFQDHWTPERFKRLTADAGIRLDIYHGVFGNTLGILNAISQQPGIGPFLSKPFLTNTVTNAQPSGRFGLSYLLTKTTVVRSSFSQIFTAPPVDLLPRPFDITQGTIGGIFNGSLRPMQATRGNIVDVSIEQQVGPRFALRSGLYYKTLKNVGDELPVNNTLLYQRLTLAGLESYGVENLLQFRPAADGGGFFGFASNTIMVAKLTGNHKDSGGIYDIDPTPATAKYIDHDRRESLAAGLGYKSRNGFWIMSNLTAATGFLNGLDPTLFGAHPARTRPVVIVGLNLGWNAPKTMKREKWAPSGVDVRITNIANNVVPINIGSPFQGTRFTLPLQVLAQLHWLM